MLAEVYQPALTKAIHESLGKVIVENMPPITENLEIDGYLSISLGKGKGNDKQIIVKIHDTIEARKNNWSEPGSGRSSPWQIPLEKIQQAQQRFLNLTGPSEDSQDSDSADAPVDLRGPRVTPTHDHETAAFKAINGANSPLTNGGSDSGSESGNNFNESIPASGNIPVGSPSTQMTIGKKAPNKMQCKICPQLCIGGLPALQAHTQEAHQRYVCRFCYNTFSLRSNLKRHERLHVGTKPYSCKVCAKSFTRSTDLKLHMSKHGMTGEDVVVPCPQCTRTFLSVQSLRWHLYKVHKETEATYACTICEKLYVDKDEYMKHREDHTNNLIQNGPASCTTSDSHDTEMDTRSSDDSDSQQLMIDTQSEGTMDNADDISRQTATVVDEISNGAEEVGLELVNGQQTKAAGAFKAPTAQSDPSSRPTPSATPTPSQSSTGSASGSRKRKIKNPTRIIEIVDEIDDEDFDLDDMYFDSPAAKAKRAEKATTPYRSGNVVMQGGDLSLLFQDEPEDLVVRPRVSTPATTSKSFASSTLSQIAQSFSNNILLSNTPISGTTNGGYSQIVDLRNSQMFSPSYIGQPRLATVTQTFPSATPILITPERYNPNPDNVKKSGGRQKTGNIPHSVAPVSKSKIESVTEAMDENKEYQCVDVTCKEVYFGFSAFEDHCMMRHGRYPCKYCKATFSGKNNRTRHMRCHLGAKTYTCPDCNKNFSRPDSMREHQFIHTKSYQEDKCRHCGSGFDKKNLLLAHLKQCYRHKMETGKSTRFIDETPMYLDNPQQPPPQQQKQTKKSKHNSDDLASLTPIKLETIPAFQHIDATFSVNMPSPSNQIPIVASLYSVYSGGSPTMPLNTSPRIMGARKNMASPLNLSGGTMTTATAASPLTIPTVVNSTAFPSPLVIMPKPTSFVGAGAAANGTARTSAVSPLLITPSSPVSHATPFVIEPIADTVPNPIMVARFNQSNSILAKSLIGNPLSNSTDATPSISPKSSRSGSPTNGNESTKAIRSGTKVLDAVQKLVDKRNAEESKDQNANNTADELGAE